LRAADSADYGLWDFSSDTLKPGDARTASDTPFPGPAAQMWQHNPENSPPLNQPNTGDPMEMNTQTKLKQVPCAFRYRKLPS
jgi:hypothetical protein